METEVTFACESIGHTLGGVAERNQRIRRSPGGVAWQDRIRVCGKGRRDKCIRLVVTRRLSHIGFHTVGSIPCFQRDVNDTVLMIGRFHFFQWLPEQATLYHAHRFRALFRVVLIPQEMQNAMHQQ